MHVSHARELANQTIDLCHLSRPVKDCCYYQWHSVVLLVMLPLVLAMGPWISVTPVKRRSRAVAINKGNPQLEHCFQGLASDGSLANIAFL